MRAEGRMGNRWRRGDGEIGRGGDGETRRGGDGENQSGAWRVNWQLATNNLQLSSCLRGSLHFGGINARKLTRNGALINAKEALNSSIISGKDLHSATGHKSFIFVRGFDRFRKYITNKGNGQ